MAKLNDIAEMVQVDVSVFGIKRTKADIAAGQTDSSIVAAVTGKKIKVLALHAQAGGTATTIVFNSASTAISPIYANAANGGVVLSFNPAGWFQTNVAEALTATTGAGSSTGITLTYIEVE